MKKTMSIALAVVMLAVGLPVVNGCKTHKIQIIENTDVVTNNVPMQAFNDDCYIWEKWTTGTNRVDSIDSIK